MNYLKLEKPVIIALCGKSASGKSTIQKALAEEYPVHKIISCTTRPPREGEIDGVDYHFLTEDEFLAGSLNGDFLETAQFRGWYYGTRKQDISNEISVGVFNPQGLKSLDRFRNQYLIVPVYIKLSLLERLKRSYRREGKLKKEYFRRAFTDFIDFWKIRKWLMWDINYEAIRTPPFAAHLIFEHIYYDILKNEE